MTRLLRVPPMTVMSAAVKSLVASLRVKVTMAVSLAASSDLLVLTMTLGVTLSMVTGSGAEGLTLPAGSVAVMVRALRPSGSAVVGVAAQVPLGCTTAVAMVLPAASWMVMVSPGVPVPLSVGVVSAVVLSPLMPVSLVASSVPAGAAGARLSMVTGSGVGALVLPAGSVAVMARLFRPWGSGLAGVAAQVPLGCTVAVAMVLPSGSLTVMTSPGVPVPLRVGVVSLVRVSVSKPLLLLGARMAAGAVAGATMVRGSGVGTLTVPAGLVCVTLRLLVPRGSGLVGVAVQVPLDATRAVAMVLPAASLMAMVLPGVPVPLKVGVVSVVVLSPWVPLSLMAFRIAPGAVGATAAALMLKLARLLRSAPSLLRLPAASVKASLPTKTMALRAPVAGVKVAV